jgi:hypothetical protein
MSPDQRSSSRVQAAKSAVAERGQLTFIVTAPRRNSISMLPQLPASL